MGSEHCYLLRSGQPSHVARGKLATILVSGMLATMLIAGCGGQSGAGSQTANPDNLAGESSTKIPTVDPSLCETKGKKVTTSDLNRDNRPDVWKLYDTVDEAGTQLEVLTCKQVDFDRDGRKDYVVGFHHKGGMLFEKIDFTFDGRFDSHTQYNYKTGHPFQVERDSDFDGAYDITERYDEKGKLSRIERDRNGDRNPDVWEQYVKGNLVAILYDDDYDKKVDRREEAPSEKKESPIPPQEDETDSTDSTDAEGPE